MNGRLARTFLFAAIAVLLATGSSVSKQRVAPKRHAAEVASAILFGTSVPARPSPAPAAAPEPGTAPGPQGAAGPQAAPVPDGPLATPAPPPAPLAPPPGEGAVSMCGGGPDVLYVEPLGLAPVTNRDTCRLSGRECCEEVKGWCLSEGFLWRGCSNCYCGAQCLAPTLFDE